MFVVAEPEVLTAVADAGILFYRRGPKLGRFVCRWDTSDTEIDTLVAAIASGVAPHLKARRTSDQFFLRTPPR